MSCKRPSLNRSRPSLRAILDMSNVGSALITNTGIAQPSTNSRNFPIVSCSDVPEDVRGHLSQSAKSRFAECLDDIHLALNVRMVSLRRVPLVDDAADESELRSEQPRNSSAARLRFDLIERERQQSFGNFGISDRAFLSCTGVAAQPFGPCDQNGPDQLRHVRQGLIDGPIIVAADKFITIARLRHQPRQVEIADVPEPG